MNSSAYLQSYGWKEGSALKSGGLRKPILVAHKKDTKGLGHGAQEHEAWWERVFDGQLKSLNVESTKEGGVTFQQDKLKISGVSQHLSPLYKMFVRGGLLHGTRESKVIDPAGGIADNEESKTHSASSLENKRAKDKKKEKTKDKKKERETRKALKKEGKSTESKSKTSKSKKSKSHKSEKSKRKAKEKVKENLEDRIRKDKKKHRKERKEKKTKRKGSALEKP